MPTHNGKSPLVKCVKRHLSHPQKRTGCSSEAKEQNSDTDSLSQLNCSPSKGDHGARRNGTFLSSFKAHHKSTPFVFRYTSLFVTIVLARSIWNSFAIARHWHAPATGPGDLPALLNPQPPSTIRGRRPESSRRKRPARPSSASSIDSLSIQVQTRDHVLALDSVHSAEGMSWTRLCQGTTQHGQHPIDSSSRILVSGILSHPLASEFVFALADHCGVETIVGLDVGVLGPESASRYAFLLRKLPSLQIHRTLYPMLEKEMEQVFQLLIPTHVIHFEPSSFQSIQTWPEAIVMRTSMEILERLCNLILKQQSHGPEKVNFLCITSTLSDETSEYLSRAHVTFYPILLQTYRVHHDIRVAELRLPELYGAFHEGASWMTEEFLEEHSTNRSNATGSPGLIHVNDAVFSVIESLTRNDLNDSKSPMTVFTPPESLLTNMGELQRAIFDLNAQRAHGVVAMRMSFMLAWHSTVANPYGTSHAKPASRKVLDFAHKQLSQNRTTGLSEVQRRRNYLFPCESECSSSEIPCRDRSAFSSILPLSKNITQNCRFVLYVADFSPKLADLPMVMDNDSVWPRETLCQVAFVSDTSSLVTSVVDAEKQSRPGAQLHTATLNGKLRHNNWQLLWVNHNIIQSEADYILPKIVPGILFSKNVTRAMYAEPKNLDSFPPLQVIWFMMAKQLDSRKQKARTSISSRSGTALGRSINIPAIPAKHTSLFVHAFAMHRDNLWDTTIDARAKFILQQKGEPVERAWPRRQLQLYEHAFDSDEFEMIDTFLMIHNLNSDRSRRLRCEWYEEQLFWSNDSEGRNRDLEDMSLSFVLASWRRDGRLTPFDDLWGERIIDVSKGDSVDVVYGDEAASQYFVKIHPTMKARKRYP